MIEDIADIGLDILELAFEGSEKKNTKKSTKPGCLIWLFVFIIIILIYLGYKFIIK